MKLKTLEEIEQKWEASLLDCDCDSRHSEDLIEEAIKRWKYYNKIISKPGTHIHTYHIILGRMNEIREFNNLTRKDLEENNETTNKG